MLPGGWTHLLYLVILAHHDRPYCNTTTYYVFGSYLQWYRDLRCPPLSSGLGDCPNNLIHSFPSPEKVPPPVYTRASYGPSTMGHIAQMALLQESYGLLVKFVLITGVPTTLEVFVLVDSGLLHHQQATRCSTPVGYRRATSR